MKYDSEHNNYGDQQQKLSGLRARSRGFRSSSPGRTWTAITTS